MADEVREEEEWLYGGGDAPQPVVVPKNDPDEEVFMPAVGDDGEGAGEEDDESGIAEASGITIEGAGGDPDGDNTREKNGSGEDDDSDDSDDGVQVVIGAITAGGAVPGTPGATGAFTPGSKRPGVAGEKKQLGKFTPEDFEQPGSINGVPAMDFNLDSLEEKPWRKPGADITDYFNYGFTEETWRAYSDRQKRMRNESGVSIQANMPMMMNKNPNQMQDRQQQGQPGQQQNSSGHINIPRMNNRFPERRPMIKEEQIPRVRQEPRENTIQVMTADRREYSRKTFESMQQQQGIPFDMSVPPPPFSGPPPEHFGGGGGGDFYNQPPPQMFYGQPPPGPPPENEYGDQQWMDSSWEMGMPGERMDMPPPGMNHPPPPGAEERISRVPRNNNKRSPSPSNQPDKRMRSDH